jgi:hypothetical protein
MDCEKRILEQERLGENPERSGGKEKRI